MVNDTSNNNIHYGTQNVLVEDNDEPVPHIKIEEIIKEGEMTIFDGRQSLDNIEITNYTWIIPKGDTVDYLYGDFVIYTFDEAGPISIKLVLTDSSGNANESSMLLEVNHVVSEDKGIFSSGIFWIVIVILALFFFIILFILFRRRREEEEEEDEFEEDEVEFIDAEIITEDKDVEIVGEVIEKEETEIELIEEELHGEEKEELVDIDKNKEKNPPPPPKKESRYTHKKISPVPPPYTIPKPKAPSVNAEDLEKAIGTLALPQDTTVSDDIPEPLLPPEPEPSGPQLIGIDTDFAITDLFLIYLDGTLIKHISPKTEIKDSMDKDILSGMLTAITDFIKDSFSEQSGSLKSLQYGKMNIYLERGVTMYLAVVFKGPAHHELRQKMRWLLIRIWEEFHNELKVWDGTLEGLEGLDEVILNLMGQDQPLPAPPPAPPVDLPKGDPIYTKATQAFSCNICMGVVKKGLDIIICNCGRKYHNSCGVRVGECPNCNIKLVGEKMPIPPINKAQSLEEKGGLPPPPELDLHIKIE